MLKTKSCRAALELGCSCHAESHPVLTMSNGRQLFRCSVCKLIWSSAYSGPEDLNTFYRDQYWTRYQEDEIGVARQNLYVHAMDWIESLYSPPGLLVDVGCGPGALLEVSQNHGWEAIGYDPSSSAVARATARGLNAEECVWPPCPLPDEQVDVVTMMNVLDHLMNPFAALEEAWRVLKKGGGLYVRVPNGTVHLWLARLLPILGLGHIPVIHLFGFGASTICHHLRRLGFTVEGIQTSPPSQKDAYSQGGGLSGRVRALLKTLNQWAYDVGTVVGLNRLAWGGAIEVFAKKHG